MRSLSAGDTAGRVAPSTLVVTRLQFERPWLASALMLLVAFAVLELALTRPLHAALSLPLATVLMAAAIRVRARLFYVTAIQLMAALGLGLPWLGAPIWLVVAPLAAIWLSLAIGLALIRCNLPFQPVPVRPGRAYRFGGTDHRVPDMLIGGPPPWLLRGEVARDLIELAAFAHDFLDRNGIRHVLARGSLLGALRHGGLIPWDADVDFALYRKGDVARLDAAFEIFRDEAAQAGFVLYRHSGHWRIARPGLWRFPALDLHVDQTLDEGLSPLWVDWEGLRLPAPPAPKAALRARYGNDCLDRAVNGRTFWQTGFVPTALSRLLGQRACAAMQGLWSRLYSASGK
ncbi:LicD family protein [Salinihabitans flavidus]|uniref:LicD family protein n=1 Tax=Salinihabitans flavidus TaxID=569882 RepID=A0A1H8PHX1_9RHOB|nr:LicD family protein [Salinihabitans flavidus]SEO41505.1 LicD family protein [Salinihabitans flavidus]